MRDRFYSTADLARVCGVSISTIKRWTDTGFLRCVRTPGGHRRYRVQDVAEAARRLGLASVDADLQPAARIDEEALLLLQGNREALAARLADSLRAGDAAIVRRTLLDLHRHGMQLAETLLLLARALAKLDTQPAGAADVDAFEKQRARALCEAAGRQLLEPRTPPPDAPAALVLARPSARAELETCIALLTLSDAGWRTIDLGRTATADALRGGLRSLRPELVVLIDEAGDAQLHHELETDAAAAGAELLVLATVDDATMEHLRQRSAAHASRLTAAVL